MVNFFSFDVSIQFLPLIRIVWIKECLITTDSIGDFSLDVGGGRNRLFCDMMRKKYNFNQYVTEPTTNNQTTIDIFRSFILPSPEYICY